MRAVVAFLQQVRSGRDPDSAARYLTANVLAHQGPPGQETAVVTRTPAGYADHVREMLSALGPWLFEIVAVRRTGDLIEATWRQSGMDNSPGPRHGHVVIEHGQAHYLLCRGRIEEYWVEFKQHPGPCEAQSPRCRQPWLAQFGS